MKDKHILKEYDISSEKSCIYRILGIDNGIVHEIYIKNPKKVFLYKEAGHAFHRIFDGITMYLVPKPGFIWGSCGEITGYCEVTWTPKDVKNPCKF